MYAVRCIRHALYRRALLPSAAVLHVVSDAFNRLRRSGEMAARGAGVAALRQGQPAMHGVKRLGAAKRAQMRREDEALRLYHVVAENYAETDAARRARARIAQAD